MENRSVTPMPWTKVALAILPGMFAIGASGIIGTNSQDVMPIAGLILCGMIGIIGATLERQVPAWSFTTWGILFGLLPTLWLPMGLPVLLATIILLISLHYRRRNVHIPRQMWAALASVVALSILPTLNGRDVTSYVFGLLWNLGATGTMLIVIAPGLLLAKRHGLLAGLFVVASGFPLWEKLLDLTYGLWSTPWGIIMVITLSFHLLIVSPIWVLRANSRCGQIWGLLLPALVALASVTVINAIVRTDPSILERIVNFGALSPGNPFVYGISGGSLGPEVLVPLLVSGGLTIAWLLAGLMLAIVCYDWIERQGPGNDGDQSGRALPKTSPPMRAGNTV